MSMATPIPTPYGYGEASSAGPRILPPPHLQSVELGEIAEDFDQ